MIYITCAAYNEETDLPALLDEISRVMKNLEYKVIITDDGSRDRTWEIIQEYSGKMPIIGVRHEVNKGLGPAIDSCFRKAIEVGGPDDVVVNMDADNSHNPAYIQRMVRSIEEGMDIVIASRFQPGSEVYGVPPLRLFLSWGARMLFRFTIRIKGVRDLTCGYRAYRLGVIEKGYKAFDGKLIEADGFACTDEILIKLSKVTGNIEEIPFTLRYDQKTGSSKINLPKTIISTIKVLWHNRKLQNMKIR